ncbi:DNA-formamidopyrimidine glycosylase [Falsibacillus pallidus]|uniref:Formamidopyrimidine-DNA glycosylase n=1 Tax=Falsibacillus pallidus TaxID=493781 RepID=A0A370GKF5_9BACI|nr:DNA-formamidopyrimidine glycosylase [Falsibacillus pallidus]RDI44238.1 DNA-(apurinic or apyrimidinic site) lyase [Falsibacillus pallidus]
MPELPEVETVRRTLVELISGKTIGEVKVEWGKIIKLPDDVQEFCHLLKGQKIHSIGRRGKFLIFYLDDYALVSHLRMEGKYGLFQQKDPIDAHTHVFFTFTDGTELRYKDVRKFGTMHLFPKGKELMEAPLNKLGPEPFSEEFTAQWLFGRLQRTERVVKAVLLDQTAVVGLGNIYVDEVLFRAGIHPERKANSLSESEVEKIRNETILTLQEAVDKGGSTIRSYLNSQGQIGMFQLQLFVYGRKGEECKKCGSVIEKFSTAGRGTHICPNCQKMIH